MSVEIAQQNDPSPGLKRKAVSEAWGEWVAGMGEWHVFGGLTYDQQRRTTVPGVDVAKAHVYRWLGKEAARAGIRVEAAVVALEYQRNGWPHFHPLLRLQGGCPPGTYGRLGQAWFKAHGYAKLEKPHDIQAVAAYAAKYLSKDLDRGDVIFWPRKGSMGISQPVLRSNA